MSASALILGAIALANGIGLYVTLVRARRLNRALVRLSCKWKAHADWLEIHRGEDGGEFRFCAAELHAVRNGR